MAAVERDVPIRVFGLGTLEARILPRIGFEVPGVLVALEADHGDRVGQGAVLARLGPASHAARVARAEAVLQSAEAQQGRVAATAERVAAVQAQKGSLALRRRELAETDAITAAARATQSLLATPSSPATSTTSPRPT